MFVAAMLSVATVARAQDQQTSAQTSTQTTTQTTAQGGQTGVQTGARGGRGVGSDARMVYRIGAPLVLEVGVRQYRADNQTGGSAGNSAARGQFESYVWTGTDLCGLSASSKEPATMPGVGWHVTGEIVNPASSGADQLTVNVTWQRVWEKGARVQNGSSGSRSIALRNGERIELDRVLPAGQSACGATDARLEASVTTQLAYRLSVVNAEARGGTRGGRGTGAAAGSGTGTAGDATVTGARGRGTGTTVTGTTTVDPATGATVMYGRGYRGSAGGATTSAGGRGTAAQGREPLKFLAISRTFDAELWLVHRKPDGTESVQQQTLRFTGGAAPNGTFTFPSIQVQTAKGAIAIDISGRLQSFVGDQAPVGGRAAMTVTTVEPSAAQHLSIKIDRRAHASGPPLLDITGGSTMVIGVPSPTDVLSFEFPALQKSAEDLLKGHQFSLRVRVTPTGR
jgi:hypothetical protein